MKKLALLSVASMVLALIFQGCSKDEPNVQVSKTTAKATVSAVQPNVAKVKPYVLDTCIVSGNKFDGSMGKIYVTTYKGREVKFCCSGCAAEFNKDPDGYIKKIELAEQQMGKTAEQGK